MRIDRFEGDTAIIELDGDVFFDIPRHALPLNAEEGDVLCISVDKVKTADKRAALKNRLDSMFQEQ